MKSARQVWSFCRNDFIICRTQAE